MYFILFVITAVLFYMWIHRAHRNLPSLGVSGLKYSPGWAVGGFFIPILNLRIFRLDKYILKTKRRHSNNLKIKIRVYERAWSKS
ncbi:DUF4328 domain-containing protein [Chloroflexota bacterium]